MVSENTDRGFLQFRVKFDVCIAEPLLSISCTFEKTSTGHSLLGVITQMGLLALHSALQLAMSLYSSESFQIVKRRGMKCWKMEQSDSTVDVRPLLRWPFEALDISKCVRSRILLGFEDAVWLTGVSLQTIFRRSRSTNPRNQSGPRGR